MNPSYIKAVCDVIGRHYCEAPIFEGENSPETGEAFASISRINQALFAQIPFKVVFTDDDPYTSAKEMREQAQATGEIRIFTGWSGHPFLTHEQNNISRAVHDVFAHCVCGCPFTFQGEYTAYLEQRRHYPSYLWAVLFAEIPAQTAAYYHTGSFDYAQRAFPAPEIWMEMCKGIEGNFKANAIIPAPAFIFP